jgi:hypothetical protein
VSGQIVAAQPAGMRGESTTTPKLEQPIEWRVEYAPSPGHQLHIFGGERYER